MIGWHNLEKWQRRLMISVSNFLIISNFLLKHWYAIIYSLIHSFRQASRQVAQTTLFVFFHAGWEFTGDATSASLVRLSLNEDTE